MPRTAGGKRVRPWRHPLCKRLPQLGVRSKPPAEITAFQTRSGAPTLQRFWRPFGVGKDLNLARASSSFDDRVRYANEKVPVARAGAQSITRKKGHQLRPPAKKHERRRRFRHHRNRLRTGQSLRVGKPQPGARSGRGLSSVCAVVPAYSGRKPSSFFRCLELQNSGTPLVAQKTRTRGTALKATCYLG